MIRIGDFSKLSRVSIKALRFYDEMGLLKPISVDRYTGYRFYEYDQLPRLHRILALKDLGFSLEVIGQLLASDLSAEQMRGMLELRGLEIKHKVQEEADRLERVDTLLRQIDQEDTMSKYDVVIKKVDTIKVASVRGVVPTPPQQGSLWGELEGYLAAQHVRPTGACFSLYHDDEYKERDLDIEVCEPIASGVKPGKRVHVTDLPAVETMACTIHQGSFTTISEAYNAIAKWIEANGYSICGPGREIYLHVTEEGQGMVSQNDPGTVTEIQFPVEKV